MVLGSQDWDSDKWQGMGVSRLMRRFVRLLWDAGLSDKTGSPVPPGFHLRLCGLPFAWGSAPNDFVDGGEEFFGRFPFANAGIDAGGARRTVRLRPATHGDDVYGVFSVDLERQEGVGFQAGQLPVEQDDVWRCTLNGGP